MIRIFNFFFFFFNETATTEIYTLSLHDALPISAGSAGRRLHERSAARRGRRRASRGGARVGDRKSTRLNSSHITTSYAVFCLKKKKKYNTYIKNKNIIYIKIKK